MIRRGTSQFEVTNFVSLADLCPDYFRCITLATEVVCEPQSLGRSRPVFLCRTACTHSKQRHMTMPDQSMSCSTVLCPRAQENRESLQRKYTSAQYCFRTKVAVRRLVASCSSNPSSSCRYLSGPSSLRQYRYILHTISKGTAKHVQYGLEHTSESELTVDSLLSASLLLC
jgi:hypothetical protein